MNNQNKVSAPVVKVSEVRFPESGNHVDVSYTKIIQNPANVNPFSLGYQLKGHPNAIETPDKKLTVWVRYQDAKSFQNLGWSVGDDVNEKSNNPVVVDIIEYETTQLEKNHGLDKDGNIRIEPMINPQTDQYIQSEKGELIFRFVEFITAGTLEELEALRPVAPKVRRARNAEGVATFDDVFDGVKRVKQDGRNRMTIEYQQFLQAMYTAYNSGVLTAITQETQPEESVI